MSAAKVEDYLAALDAADREAIDALRIIAMDAHPGLTERIKWNAPSFAIGDEDRITLGINRGGGYRVVLHRGARANAETGFAFDDPDGLAQWPAPDRGVINLAGADAIQAKRDALRRIFSRWIDTV